MDPSKRTLRLFHLLVVLTLFMMLLDWPVSQVAAQDDPGTPTVSPEQTVPDQANPEPTIAPTETITDALIDPTATLPLPETPTTVPASDEAAPSATSPIEPTAVTETPQPASKQSEISVAGAGTAIRVTVSSGDQNGPRVAGVCMSLRDHSPFNMMQSSGCSDDNGQVTLSIFFINGPSSFTVRVDQPAGYYPVYDLWVGANPGEITPAALVLSPLPAVSDTLNTIDSTSGNPVGGACWSYYANAGGAPGALAIGPVCDTDNDGVTTVGGIIPVNGYCLVISPPAGYQLVGADTSCLGARSDGMTTTRALSSSASIGTGVAQISIKTAWGAPLAGVCLDASLVVNAQSFVAASGCSDSTGILALSGLADGAYSVVATSWPNNFTAFATQSFVISGGGNAVLNITMPSATAGTWTLKTLYSYGPQTVGGTCWNAYLNDGSGASTILLAGPACDTDGDGIATMSGVPAAPFCLVATPPTGFYRPDGNYSYCSDQAQYGSATINIGIVQLPPTPTAIPSGTATAIPTPAPTQTPPPTPSPAPSEPNGNVLARNCAADFPTQDGGVYLNSDMCYAVGAGVRFALFQGGAQVGEVTTGANGSFAVTLPSREPYELHYLDGNDAIYVPFSGQESLLRYGASGQFIFVRDASVDRTYTLTVRVVSANGGEAYQPLGGACFRIVDNTGAERLPVTCDTDNDGVIVMGQLTPVDVAGSYGAATRYAAVMTQAPPGYDLFTGEIPGGAFDPANPNSWTATYSYRTNSLRVHYVDANGNPVAGFCLRVPDWVSGGILCDGSGSNSDSTADGAADGVVVVPGVPPGRSGVYSIVSSPIGYLADSETQSYTLTTGVFTDVYWPVHPYGSAQANQADVLFKLVATDPTVDSYEYSVSFTQICFSLSPNRGQTPTGARCPSKDGELLFRNVPQGAYTLKLEWNYAFCGFPAIVPATTSVTVGADDLGKQKVVTIPVDGCGRQSGSSCTAFKTLPTGRSVDAYYGTLTDSNGSAVLSTLQLSETVSESFTEALLASGNIDPVHLTASSLAPWTERAPYLSGATDWAAQPDWDANAYQSMLNAYGQSSGDYVLGERISRGSQAVAAGTTSEFFFTDPATFRQDYPEFSECPADTEDLFVIYLHTSTLNLYEMNASEPAPVTPSPTPYASPEPLCNTTVARNVTVWYGTLTDDHGNAVLSGLALSDHIPSALRAAIVHGDPPGNVGDDIGNWVGSGLLDETWAESTPEQLDPAASLRGQLSNGGDVSFGTPSAGQTVEYRYTTYRYLDYLSLPAGCAPSFPEQSFRSAALSVLIPVSQETVVQVTYIEQNASLAAGASPTATATATATAPATTSPTAVPAGPTATSSSSAVTGLPNTGGQPNASGRDNLLFAMLALLLTMAVAFAIRTRRRPR